MKKVLAVIAAAGLCSVASANPLATLEAPLSARAVKAQPAVMLPNGKVIVTGPAVTLESGLSPAALANVFDSIQLDGLPPFETIATGFEICAPLTTIPPAQPGSRWAYAATTNLQRNIDDFQTVAGAGGQNVLNASFLARFDTAVTTTAIVGFFLNDETSSCPSTLPTTPSDGVILTYNLTTAGTFWLLGADLSTLPTPLPADGNGTAIINIATAFDQATGEFTYGAGASMGLWGTANLRTPAGPQNGTTLADHYVGDNLGSPLTCNTNGVDLTTLCSGLPRANVTWAMFADVQAPPTCRVDFNSDGELTFDDIQLFIQLFNANDNRADLNSDQEWTFDDIQLFISLFNAGC